VEVEQRPDEAFTTDRAVRSGRANAASGRIMVSAPARPRCLSQQPWRLPCTGRQPPCLPACFQVTTPNDHFGPIPAEHDPERNRVSGPPPLPGLLLRALPQGRGPSAERGLAAAADPPARRPPAAAAAGRAGGRLVEGPAGLPPVGRALPARGRHRGPVLGGWPLPDPLACCARPPARPTPGPPAPGPSSGGPWGLSCPSMRVWALA
jgi:hypothetical protein